MIVDCISDLHGSRPILSGGDLLIVAGDCTTNDTIPSWKDFYDWLEEQKYELKVLIGGNHDGFLEQCVPTEDLASLGEETPEGYVYLYDTGCEFKGLKIWGSPWTKRFKGINKHCMAFTKETEAELKEKFSLIPDNTDILVTHSPPYGIMDKVQRWDEDGRNPWWEYVGNPYLQQRLYGETLKPKLHVFGHIHEGYGHIPKMMDYPHTQFVNASIMNENYDPVNKPIRIIL